MPRRFFVMLLKVKRSYLRLVRRVYRMLRHERLRDIEWLQLMIRPVFDRELWHPCRGTVADGLAIGLFCAMIPLPFQMIFAAIASIKRKANIPTAVAACWVTNPFTVAPIFIAQEGFGSFLVEVLHFPIPPILAKAHLTVPLLNQDLNVGHFIIGFFASALLLGLLAYPIVYAISALVPKMIPKKRITFMRKPLKNFNERAKRLRQMKSR